MDRGSRQLSSPEMAVSQKNELTIRAARPEDDIRCSQILAAAWMASEVPDQLPHALDMFDDGAPLPPGIRYRLVAEMPNLVAGFADVRLTQRHVWYLFVEPDFQGIGIGSALLDEAQKIMGGYDDAAMSGVRPVFSQLVSGAGISNRRHLPPSPVRPGRRVGAFEARTTAEEVAGAAYYHDGNGSPVKCATAGYLDHGGAKVWPSWSQLSSSRMRLRVACADCTGTTRACSWAHFAGMQRPGRAIWEMPAPPAILGVG